MKSTLLTIIAIAASCSLSQAAVTFSSIQQDVDGALTSGTLMNVTGASGSTQVVTGDLLGVGVPYETFAFSVDLSAAAGSPTPGTASATLQFTVSSDTDYADAVFGSFIGTVDGPKGASGTLTAGQLYIMSNSLTGGAATPTPGFLGMTVVPEPTTSLLALVGFVGLLRRRR